MAPWKRTQQVWVKVINSDNWAVCPRKLRFNPQSSGVALIFSNIEVPQILKNNTGFGSSNNKTNGILLKRFWHSSRKSDFPESSFCTPFVTKCFWFWANRFHYRFNPKCK